MKEKTKITPLKNGPYLVSGKVKLINLDNNTEIACDGDFALCRCGGSQNKPFCDGTHASTGFSGDRGIDKPLDQYKKYEGDKVDVYDNRTICGHAEYCVRLAPKSFIKGGKPWIDASASSPEEIERVVRACPSGALKMAKHDKDPKEVHKPGGKQIGVKINAPYVVQGGIELDADPAAPTEDMILCSCGLSKNKPFCDGSHHSIKS